MKSNAYKIYSLIAVICCINSIFSANTTWTWSTSAGSTSWATKTNWVTTDPDATIGVGDTAVITSGGTNYPVLTASVSITRLKMTGGSMTITGTTLTLANAMIMTGGTFTATTGSLTVTTGGLSIIGGTYNSTTGNITVSGGGLSIGTGGSLASTTGTIGITGNISMSGNAIFNKTSTGTVSVSQDLIIGNTSSFSPGTGTLNVSSDILMSSGTFSKTSGNINITVNLDLSGGTFSKGSGTLDINGDFLLSGSTTIFNANSGLTDVLDDFIMTNGTVNGGTSDIRSASEILISGGTFNVGSDFDAANVTVSGGSLVGGTSDFNTIPTITVSGTGSFTKSTGTLTIGSLTISGDGIFTKTGTSTVAITADLTISGGTFTAGTANIWNIGDDFFMSDTGILNANTSTFNITDDITMTGGIVNGGTSDIGANSVATISGGTFNIGAILSAITSINFTGATITSISTSDITTNLLNITSGTVGLGDDIIIETLTISGGTIGFGAADMDINISVTISGGTVNAGTADLHNGGGFIGTVAISGGTVNATTIAALDCSDLTLTGTATLNIAGNRLNVDDDLTLNGAGASINISVANMVAPDDFIFSAGTLDLNNFNMNVADEFTYKGGTLTDEGIVTVLDLLVDHTGTITLDFNINIDGSALFIDGILVTSASAMLILDFNATVSGASQASHIAGPVRKLVNTSGTTSPFVFPIGNGNFYAPITISTYLGASTGDFFTAQYDKEFPPFNRSSKDNTMDHVSAGEYWVLDRGTSGGANTTTALVGLRYDVARSGSINNTNQLRVARWDSDSSKWKDHGAGTVTGTIGTGGTVTGSVRVSKFSPFTLGSTSVLSPLPVKLLNFNALPVEKQVKVNWATTSEINNDFFTVQKSLDGKTWRVIGIVDGVENSTQLTNYSFMDRAPVNGMQYYRLIQTDLNGKSTISNIVTINMLSGVTLPSTITISPNPVVDMVNVNMSESANNASILVYNSVGMKVMELNNQYGSVFILDMSLLANGIYTIEVHHENGVNISKIIKN